MNTNNSMDTPKIEQNRIPQENVSREENKASLLLDKINGIFESLGKVKPNEKLYFDKNTDRFGISGSGLTDNIVTNTLSKIPGVDILGDLSLFQTIKNVTSKMAQQFSRTYFKGESVTKTIQDLKTVDEGLPFILDEIKNLVSTLDEVNPQISKEIAEKMLEKLNLMETSLQSAKVGMTNLRNTYAKKEESITEELKNSCDKLEVDGENVIKTAKEILNLQLSTANNKIKEEFKQKKFPALTEHIRKNYPELQGNVTMWELIYPEGKVDSSVRLLKKSEQQNHKIDIDEETPPASIDQYPSMKSLQEAGMPFHFAVENKDLQLMKLLDEAGGDISQVDSKGNNALMAAVSRMTHKGSAPLDLEMITFLIDKGVSLTQKNHEGDSALLLLSKMYPTSNRKINNAIFEAFSEINDENREAALNVFFNVNKDVYGQFRTSLSEQEYQFVTNQLISNGLNVDTPDKLGRTALYWAVLEGKLSHVKLLMKFGANPEFVADKNIRKNTLSPLALAQENQKSLDILTKKEITGGKIERNKEKESKMSPEDFKEYDENFKFKEKMQIGSHDLNVKDRLGVINKIISALQKEEGK